MTSPVGSERGDERRFLALGDSYTIGEAVAIEDGWCSQLVARLRATGLRVAAPLIVARTGWTTDELAAGLDAADPVGPFDLLTLLVGVNDQYRGGTPEEFRPRFAGLLAHGVSLVGGNPRRVVVLSIPDWGVTEFARGRDCGAIARTIDAFNAVVRDETMRADACFVDVTAISRQAAREPDLIAGDGLHPSRRMYAMWTDHALHPVMRALDSERLNGGSD